MWNKPATRQSTTKEWVVVVENNTTKISIAWYIGLVGFYIVLATQHSTGSFYNPPVWTTTDARLENLGSTTTMAVAFDKLD